MTVRFLFLRLVFCLARAVPVATAVTVFVTVAFPATTAAKIAVVVFGIVFFIVIIMAGGGRRTTATVTATRNSFFLSSYDKKQCEE